MNDLQFVTLLYSTKVFFVCVRAWVHVRVSVYGTLEDI